MAAPGVRTALPQNGGHLTTMPNRIRSVLSASIFRVQSGLVPWQSGPAQPMVVSMFGLALMVSVWPSRYVTAHTGGQWRPFGPVTAPMSDSGLSMVSRAMRANVTDTAWSLVILSEQDCARPRQ